jgi:uncharacterized protein
MIEGRLISLLAFFVLWLSWLPNLSEGRPIPKYRAPVNDYTGALLAPVEAKKLNQELIAFEDSTGIQIAVCIEPTLGGESEFDRSLAIARGWGVGSKESNNGVLIYIALEDRAIFIQTGYGAEGFLPDAIAKRIVEEIMKPYFRQGRYYEGLRLAIQAIKSRGAEENFPKVKGQRGEEIPMWLIVLIVFVILFIMTRTPRKGGGLKGGGPVIFPPVSRGGGFSGWGGSAGGWGGFGGGGFGGGGAGGRW